MDWSKAKNILIIILIITNIMILYVINASKYKPIDTSDETVSQYTSTLLEENNIFLDVTTMPKNPKKMPSLTVMYDTYDNTIINKKIKNGDFDQEVEMNETGLKEYCDNIIKEEKIGTGEPKECDVEINGQSAKVTYKNNYKEVPIEKCEMTFSFENRKLTGFDRKWLDIEETSSTKKVTISAESALLKMMNQVDKNEPVHVKDIEIVYMIDSYELEDEQPISDTAFPSWKIVFNNDEITYISAFKQ